MPTFRIKPRYTEASDGDVLMNPSPPASPEPEPEPQRKEKRRRQLSDKQLEALAKGRAKVAENRLKKQKKRRQ